MVLAHANTCIDFTSPQQVKPSRLYCSKDGFVGERTAIATSLQFFFQAKEGKAYKINSPDPFAGKTSVTSSISITDALKQMEMDHRFEQRLLTFCERLPNVAVKLVSLHRSGFDGVLLHHYLDLHRISVRSGRLNMAAWIKEAPDDVSRHQRLQLFVAVFCLGIIAPKKAESDSAQQRVSAQSKEAASKQSILNRIIRRVRGI